MTVYIGNPKASANKLLELIIEFSKIAGYKINAQKPITFLYNNRTMNIRKPKLIPFTVTPKKMKSLDIHLTKQI